MDLHEAITAFVLAVDDARNTSTATVAQHIIDTPEHLQGVFEKAIKAVVDARYDHAALQAAAELIPAPEGYPGGLGEMIQALMRVFIDNDAFDLP
jgi:predicted ATPase